MYKQWLDDYFISVQFFYYNSFVFDITNTFYSIFIFPFFFNLESGHGAKMLKHRFLQTVRSTKINTKNYWIKFRYSSNVAGTEKISIWIASLLFL